MDLEQGSTEMYIGHTDIIISLDVHQGLIVTGAKDNESRLWKYDPEGDMFKKIRCIAVFKGHTQNISSVNFAPKRGQSFVSCS